MNGRAAAAPIRHSKVVPDIQDAVLHATPVVESDGVELYAPKLSPETVTMEPPVEAAFNGACALATGAATKRPQLAHCVERASQEVGATVEAYAKTAPPAACI